MIIATSPKGHTAKKWENEDLTWQQICDRIHAFKRAGQTRAEFDALSKEEQTQIKNLGGAFVGGALKDGLRKKGNVESRSLITLDIDNARTDVFDRIAEYNDMFGNTVVTYTTFKSKPEAPRLRVILPLKKAIPEQLYEPVARMIALKMEVLEACDPAGFSANQLMFWPCYAKDCAADIREYEGHPLDASEIVASYDDIDDERSWPMQERERAKRQSQLRAEDPLQKGYPIGTFCRAYTIQEAIKTFLPDVYEEVSENRYHFKIADSSAGAVVYDDKFFYSHHSSDPAYGVECNAFDLVRIHKFGALDDNARAGTPFNRLPSFQAMMELAGNDKRVAKLQLKEEFSGEFITDKKEIQNIEADASTDWMEKLEKDKAGNVKNTLSNLGLIIEYDPNLQSIKYDLFSDCFCVDGELPWAHEGRGWNETDLSCLCLYIAQRYRLNATANVFTALTATVRHCRSYHPVREYLRRQQWDGTLRVDTLLTKYLGAEDSELNRAIIHKTLVAAVARVMHPGIKYDSMMVLVGGQGIGKSRILRLLGGEWFSDSLTLSDMKDKNGVEKLNGAWISEVAELSGMRKTDSETIKGFITRQDDRMRPAYGHTVVSKPRQGIFIGTTNETEGFLRDLTGNRRYMAVKVQGVEGFTPEKWDLDSNTVNQIWAEAVHYYDQKESLFLPEHLQEQLTRLQEELLEDDSRIGDLQKYLDTLLPVEWPEMNKTERIDYLNQREYKPHTGTVMRREVCVAEIWAECFEGEKVRLERRNSLEIASMLIKLGWRQSGKIRDTGLYGRQRIFYKKFKSTAQNDTSYIEKLSKEARECLG